MRPFRFGILTETMGTAQEWQDKARKAEALGYSTLLIRDHFVPDFQGNTFAPLAALAVAAATTRTLRVGTLVLDNDFRHPVVMAKELATLDWLSGGRVELGLGAGWLQVEYDRMGIPFDAPGIRVSRLEESVRIYKAFFSQETISFCGDFYQVENLHVFPRPQQRIPILIGANKRRMCHIAGREADIVGIMTVSTNHGTVQANPEELLPHTVEQKIAWIKEGAGDRLHEIELSSVASIIITSEREEAARDLIHKNNWNNITIEQVLSMPARFIGTVEEIANQMLQRRERYGISYYVVSDHEMELLAPVIEKLKFAERSTANIPS